MASTRRIPVLNFHGNGGIVCLEGLKPQAPSAKLQASSKARQNVARQYVLLTQAPSTKLQATSIKRQAT
jgi:hypothetical protein